MGSVPGSLGHRALGPFSRRSSRKTLRRSARGRSYMKNNIYIYIYIYNGTPRGHPGVGAQQARNRRRSLATRMFASPIRGPELTGAQLVRQWQKGRLGGQRTGTQLMPAKTEEEVGKRDARDEQPGRAEPSPAGRAVSWACAYAWCERGLRVRRSMVYCRTFAHSSSMKRKSTYAILYLKSNMPEAKSTHAILDLHCIQSRVEAPLREAFE